MLYHNQWLQLLAVIGFCAMTGYYAYLFGKAKGYSEGRSDGINGKDRYKSSKDFWDPY